MSPLATLLPTAQAAAEETAEVTLIQMPAVEWAMVSPILVLLGGASIVLLVAALFRRTSAGAQRRWVRPFTLWGTVATAVVAAGLSIRSWADATSADHAVGAVADALHIDGFAVFVTVLICAVVVIAALVADGYFASARLHSPEVLALMLLSGSGGVVMASANDLIVLFLGLEILSIALYVLAGSQVRQSRSQEAALKYFLLGAFSSAVLLYGIALTYGATGSTNFTDMKAYLASNVVFSNLVLTGGIVLMLVGFGFKVAAVPFHMWTPDVYQGAPSPATGFMAAAAKAAGFAAMMRVLFGAELSESDSWRPVLWVLALLTMFVGAVMAARQRDVKRLMGYSSITHAGFVLLGVYSSADDGRTAALFYLAAYAFVVLGSFTVISLVSGSKEESGYGHYRGLARRSPLLAVALTLFLMAQAGIPMTSGFMAKFGVIRAAAGAHAYLLAIAAMLASVIAAYGYLRVVVAMFGFDDDGEGTEAEALAQAPKLRVPFPAQVALVVCAAATILWGIAPQVLLYFAEAATLR